MTPLSPNSGPTYRALDRLDANDLTEWQRVPLFTSARHFRSLHRLYGVADGLNVTLEQDSRIVVSPGVAFDAYGRPMVLDADVKSTGTHGSWIVLRGEQPAEQQLRVPVPAPQQCRVVVLSEADAAAGLVPWDVPLARLEHPTEKQTHDTPTLDLSVRPVAVRTFRRPYLATGKVPAGTTAVSLPKNCGWQVWVDTSAAGFLAIPVDEESDLQTGHTVTAERRQATRPSLTGLPVYLVSVGQQTRDDAQRLRTGQTVLDGKDHLDQPAPLVTVSEITDKGFLLTADYGESAGNRSKVSATPLEISWTGIEPRIPANRALSRKVVDSEGFAVNQKAVEQQMLWPDFRNEQRLTASDLNSVQETIRQLQWIHNRTLHDWGVARGCEVTVLPGRRSVLIQRGYGINVRGQEIILTDPTQLDVPAQKVSNGPFTRKTWWVTASYRDVPAPRSDSHCNQQGIPVRRLAEAAVRWRDPEQNDKESRLEPGLDLILATVVLDRGEIVDVTPAGRRSAVPSQRPYVAAGRSSVVDKWNHLRCAEGSNTVTFTITIDTSQAGFVSPPHYVIQVEERVPDSQPHSTDPEFCSEIESAWKQLKAAFRKSRPDFVAVVNSRSGNVEVKVNLVLSASSSGLALIRKLQSSDDQQTRQVHPNHECRVLKAMKERLLSAIPFQFAWFGIEV